MAGYAAQFKQTHYSSWFMTNCNAKRHFEILVNFCFCFGNILRSIRANTLHCIRIQRQIIGNWTNVYASSDSFNLDVSFSVRFTTFTKTNMKATSKKTAESFIFVTFSDCLSNLSVDFLILNCDKWLWMQRWMQFWSLMFSMSRFGGFFKDWIIYLIAHIHHTGSHP